MNVSPALQRFCARTSKDISLEVLSIHRSSYKTAQAAKLKKKNFPTKARARAAAREEVPDDEHLKKAE
jgi:hypothetical protein